MARNGDKRAKRPEHLRISRLAAADGAASQTPGVQTPIVQTTNSAQNTDAYRAVSLKVVSGGLLTKGAVVFSSDSAQFFVAKGSAVAVYNARNGEMVQNFSAQGRRAAVVAVVAGRSARHVYTFSADARARLWDADTGAQLGEWALGARPEHAAADPARAGAFYVVLRRRQRQKRRRLAADGARRHTVSRVELGAGAARVEELFRATGLAGLAVRADGRWVAAFAKFRVHAARVGGGACVHHAWAQGERVSALAFSGDAALAVGDWRGRIVEWHCLDDGAAASADRAVVRRTHHWHAHRVNALAAAGALLLSGGEEGVLVLWQLRTGARDYLPRLGSDIVGIAVSPDATRYALTLRDNTVRVVRAADRALESQLQGLRVAEPTNAQTTGLAVHPATRALALGAEPGCVQLFDAAADRHVASVEVAAYNRVGAGARPHVDRVQFSADGAWMATADARAGAAALKFWRLDPQTQRYRLATRVDAPHAGRVTALAFRPRADPPQCVTTGRADAAFRVWELHAASGAWVCRHEGRFRAQPARGAAYSADGSTLAVGFGGAVTLWDARACALVAALVAGAATPRLRAVAFVGASPYVAAWSRARLDVWNMLTASLWWTLALPVQSVYVHPRAPLLAVAAYQLRGSRTASVMVLAPESPQPVLALQVPGGVDAVALVPADVRAPADAALKPDPLDANSLVVLSPSGLLSVYAADAAEASAEAPAAADRSAMDTRAFASIFGAQPPAVAADAAPPASAHVRDAMRLVRAAVRASYVDAPSHVLPPVASLYAKFASAQLLPSAAADHASADHAPAEDSDADMPDAPPAVPHSHPDLWNSDFYASMRRGFGLHK
ncbi:NET1-associated nuclear protein 1 [Coemansia sp. Cherry 401B]|nr:NET1-associated nuclear protein 1 [Coemansia sp. Cherry 401B]